MVGAMSDDFGHLTEEQLEGRLDDALERYKDGDQSTKVRMEMLGLNLEKQCRDFENMDDTKLVALLGICEGNVVPGYTGPPRLMEMLEAERTKREADPNRTEPLASASLEQIIGPPPSRAKMIANILTLFSPVLLPGLVFLVVVISAIFTDTLKDSGLAQTALMGGAALGLCGVLPVLVLLGPKRMLTTVQGKFVMILTMIIALVFWGVMWLCLWGIWAVKV